ncbi:MAG: hypothetical protein ABJ013_06720 [Halioglobus sp.]
MICPISSGPSALDVGIAIKNFGDAGQTANCKFIETSEIGQKVSETSNTKTELAPNAVKAVSTSYTNMDAKSSLSVRCILPPGVGVISSYSVNMSELDGGSSPGVSPPKGAELGEGIQHCWSKTVRPFSNKEPVVEMRNGARFVNYNSKSYGGEQYSMYRTEEGDWYINNWKHFEQIYLQDEPESCVSKPYLLTVEDVISETNALRFMINNGAEYTALDGDCDEFYAGDIIDEVFIGGSGYMLFNMNTGKQCRVN